MTGMKMKVFGGCRVRRLVHGTEPLPLSMGRSPVCLSVRPLVCFCSSMRLLGCSSIFGLVGRWEFQGDGHGWLEQGTTNRAMGKASSSPRSPTAPPLRPQSSSRSSHCQRQLPPPSSVVHGHLPRLISRESGEKAGLREGEERREGNRMARRYLCFIAEAPVC